MKVGESSDMIMYPTVYLKRFFSKMLPKGMYQIARIEFQKMHYFSSSGFTSTLRHLPVHASAERGAGALLWSLPLQHSPPPPGEKQSLIWLCLSFVPFMLGLYENIYTKYDLRKFVIVFGVCIKIRTCRSE